jgi:hypothetical protein
MKHARALASPILVLALLSFTPSIALAHCDGLDGPVVKAAQKALAERNPALVLIWVQPTDEPEIRTAFERTLAVRALGPEARELADRFFFETVVRLHRAAEGEPFTGLKPAGRDLGLAIPAADKAIADGNVEPLITLLTETLQEHLRARFHHVIDKKTYKSGDVAAGRAYVEVYVEFMHFVERVFEAAIGSQQSLDHKAPVR